MDGTYSREADDHTACQVDKIKINLKLKSVDVHLKHEDNIEERDIIVSYA